MTATPRYPTGHPTGILREPSGAGAVGSVPTHAGSGKQAAAPARSLADVSVLVADAELNILGLTRSLLNGFGIRKVKLLSDAYAVLDIVEAGGIDVLMVDADLAPLNGLEITKYVRLNKASHDRYLPVILTTTRPSMSLIMKARNIGVTELLAKPMTMRAVEQRVRAVVERPRPFVRCPNYFGPDRRRGQDPRYQGPDRRAAPDDLIEI